MIKVHILIVFVFVWIIFSNITCSPVENSMKGAAGNKLSFHWQFVQLKEGKTYLIDIKDSIFELKRGKHFVFGLIIQKTLNQQNLLTDSFAYDIYIYRDGESFGVKYNLTSEFEDISRPERFIVDSFLVKNTFKNMDVHNQNDSLVDSSFSMDNYYLMETYVPSKYGLDSTSDENYDSLYCYYSMESFETIFTFSESLETKKNRKLVRVVYIFDSYDKDNLRIPKRSISWSLQKSSFPNASKLDKLIQRSDSSIFLE